MRITVNGKVEEIPENLSILSFLELKYVSTDHVLVELNRNIIKKEHLNITILAESDRLEIVRLVGGG